MEELIKYIESEIALADKLAEEHATKAEAFRASGDIENAELFDFFSIDAMGSKSGLIKALDAINKYRKIGKIS